MGSYDSCEFCEIIGLFLLAKIQDMIIKRDLKMIIAIYRDDIILVTIKHGKTINSIKSILTKLFNEEKLVLCEWSEGEVQS